MTLLDIATACNLHRDSHGDWKPLTPTHNTYAATYNDIDRVWGVFHTRTAGSYHHINSFASEYDALLYIARLMNVHLRTDNTPKYNGPPTVEEVTAAINAWRAVPAHDIARVDNTTAEYFGVLLAKAYLDAEIAKR